MNFSRQSVALFLINFAYISSIIYIPLVIANNSVLNRVFPFFALCLLLFILRSQIKTSLFMKFPVFFLISIASLLSAGSFISLAYTIVFITLISFVFPYSVLINLYGKDFLYKHLKFIVGVSIITALIGWVEFLNPTIVDQFFFLRGSIYLHKGQVSSLFSNPNVFGLMMAFTFQIVCLLYRNVLIVVLFFAFFYSTILLSESRMAIFLVYLILILRIIPLINISPKILISLITSFTIILSLNFTFLFEFLDLNFRDEIWEGARKAFFSNPILGIGLGQFQEDVSFFASGYKEQSVNNLFVGLLSELGIIGLILFTYFWLKPIISYKRRSNHNLWLKSSTALMILINSQFSEYMILYVGPYVLLIVLFIAAAEWAGE